MARTRRLLIALSPIAVALLLGGVLAWKGDPHLPLWRRPSYLEFGLLIGLTTACAIGAAVLLARPGQRRRRATRIGAAIASTLLGCALLELPTALGKDFGETFGTSDHSAWWHVVMANNRPDPELIHVHWPRQEFRGKVAGNLDGLGIGAGRRHSVHVRYDRNGFRNEHERDRADVIVIGDSFVEGAIVPYEETLPVRLEENLGRPTVNLGQINYTFQQELVVLKRYGVPLRPKVVVWCLFGGNDLRDATAYDWQREHLNDLRFVEPRSFAERSFLANLVKGLARSLRPEGPTERACRHRGFLRVPPHEGQPIYFGASEGPYEPRAWDIGQRALLDARKVCEELGARLLVVYVPRKLRVYREHCTFAPESHVPRWPQNDFPKILAEFSERHGIDYLDTTIPLTEAVARGEHTYHFDDVHWNGHGHAIASRAIAALIRERGWLP